MKTVLVFGLVLTLAACGADGDPITPTANTNVTLSSNGIGVGTNLRLGRGPFSINLGTHL